MEVGSLLRGKDPRVIGWKKTKDRRTTITTAAAAASRVVSAEAAAGRAAAANPASAAMTDASDPLGHLLPGFLPRLLLLLGPEHGE